MTSCAEAWAEVLARVVDDAHLVTGDRLSIMLAEAVRDVGLTADALLVDLAQQVLTPLAAQRNSPVQVEGTIAGRARTFASERVVVTALLEPHDQVAGDAYDYAADSTTLDLAVFDAVGHDMQACLTSALALTAIRNARRAGETDLAAMAGRASQLVTEQAGPLRFVTAVLARLDTDTGLLHYLLAGHPPPLLVRSGRVVKELAHPPRRPLGLPSAAGGDQGIAREQLEPGDRLLLYSDGVVEARDAAGEFFGEQRLVDFTERASLAELSAPETLRRLASAVLAHQGGRLQDDATLLMVDWSANGHRRMSPTLA